LPAPLLLTPWSQKLATLRQEADLAIDRAEAAEAKNKKYEQELLQKEQEITSLNHRLSVLDTELEKSEGKTTELKGALTEVDASKATNESLSRKIVVLEEELDTAEKNVRETMEKCVPPSYPFVVASFVWQTPTGRRQGGALRTSNTARGARARSMDEEV
jgi:predicted  nucleic acid-binding Zn-ribbon protein